jgi:hypothetical protein
MGDLLQPWHVFIIVAGFVSYYFIRKGRKASESAQVPPQQARLITPPPPMQVAQGNSNATEQRFCSECGKQILRRTKFCPFCGSERSTGDQSQ